MTACPCGKCTTCLCRKCRRSVFPRIRRRRSAPAPRERADRVELARRMLLLKRDSVRHAMHKPAATRACANCYRPSRLIEERRVTPESEHRMLYEPSRARRRAFFPLPVLKIGWRIVAASREELGDPRGSRAPTGMGAMRSPCKDPHRDGCPERHWYDNPRQHIQRPNRQLAFAVKFGSTSVRQTRCRCESYGCTSCCARARSALLPPPLLDGCRSEMQLLRLRDSAHFAPKRVWCFGLSWDK